MGPLCIHIIQTKFIVVKRERDRERERERRVRCIFANATLIGSLQLEFLLQQTTSSNSNSSI